MMRKFIIPGAIALTSASLALGAYAAEGSMLGQSEPANAATKTIVIGPETSYVNVRHGDVVKFVVGDKSFAWGFSEPGTISEIDLNRIAPHGTFDHPVKAYIKRIPVYDGA